MIALTIISIAISWTLGLAVHHYRAKTMLPTRRFGL
jgi:hypothetical protein